MSYTIGTNFPEADRMALLDAILNVTNEDFRKPEEIGLPVGRSMADLQSKCVDYDAVLHRDRMLMQEMLFDGDPSSGTPQATDWTKFHAHFDFKDATAFTEANLTDCIPQDSFILRFMERPEATIYYFLASGRGMRIDTATSPPMDCLLYTSPSPRDS